MVELIKDSYGCHKWNKEKYVVAIYLYIQNTFDTVDHKTLLTFLEDPWIRGIVNNLIKDLANHTIQALVVY